VEMTCGGWVWMVLVVERRFRVNFWGGFASPPPREMDREL
jgi:hypothetical protein